MPEAKEARGMRLIRAVVVGVRFWGARLRAALNIHNVLLEAELKWCLLDSESEIWLNLKIVDLDIWSLY